MPNSLLGTYLRFLRSPNLTGPPIALSKFKTTESILRLYSVHLVVLLIALGLIGLIPNAQDSNNLLDGLEAIPVWYIPIMAVIIAPLLEECIFRLPLRAFTLNLLLPICLIALIVFGRFAGAGAPLPLIFAIALASIYIGSKGTKLTKLQSFYNKFPHVVFYGIALLFGAIHITNYDSQVWPFLPILVLPQIVIGLLLGFVRLRYGFIWAFLLHAFHNGCLVLPIFIVMMFGSENLQRQFIESAEVENLSRLDQLMTGAIGLYVVGGIIVLGVTAWKTIKEWRVERRSSQPLDQQR